MSQQKKANIMLLIATMIWGSAFVAQSSGMDYVGPFTFLSCRSLLGALTLLPVLLWTRRHGSTVPPTGSRRDLLLCSVLCGTVLFAAAILQQIGLLYTTAGKSGFITTLYVVLVLLGSLFLGRKLGPLLWVSVALAAAALYLLCMNDTMTLGLGELLTLGSALCFSIHILIIDHFAERVDGISLSCLQFLLCGILSGIAALTVESPSLSAVSACWLPIAYAGVLSSGGGFTLQILAQRNTNPTVASLLMSLESVFAVLFGALLLHERLSLREYLGCGLMFVAVVLSQLPVKLPQRS